MTRTFGFIGLLIVLGIGAYIFMRQTQAVTPAAGLRPGRRRSPPSMWWG